MEMYNHILLITVIHSIGPFIILMVINARMVVKVNFEFDGFVILRGLGKW